MSVCWAVFLVEVACFLVATINVSAVRVDSENPTRSLPGNPLRFDRCLLSWLTTDPFNVVLVSQEVADGCPPAPGQLLWQAARTPVGRLV